MGGGGRGRGWKRLPAGFRGGGVGPALRKAPAAIHAELLLKKSGHICIFTRKHAQQVSEKRGQTQNLADGRSNEIPIMATFRGIHICTGAVKAPRGTIGAGFGSDPLNTL